MSNRLVITASTIDSNGAVISIEEISDKEITEPTNISNFGYNKKEELKIIHNIQQALLQNQASFLK